MAKVERYLRQTFANHSIRVVARPKKSDSAEVYIGEEFVGVLFVDDGWRSLVQLHDGDPRHRSGGLIAASAVNHGLNGA